MWFDFCGFEVLDKYSLWLSDVSNLKTRNQNLVINPFLLNQWNHPYHIWYLIQLYLVPFDGRSLPQFTIPAAEFIPTVIIGLEVSPLQSLHPIGFPYRIEVSASTSSKPAFRRNRIFKWFWEKIT